MYSPASFASHAAQNSHKEILGIYFSPRWSSSVPTDDTHPHAAPQGTPTPAGTPFLRRQTTFTTAPSPSLAGRMPPAVIVTNPPTYITAPAESVEGVTGSESKSKKAQEKAYFELNAEYSWKNFGFGFLASTLLIELLVVGLYAADCTSSDFKTADKVFNAITNMMWSVLGLDNKPNEAATAGMVILSGGLFSLAVGAAAMLLGGKQLPTAKPHSSSSK